MSKSNFVNGLEAIYMSEFVLPDIAMGFPGAWISSWWFCLPATFENLRNPSACKSSSTLTSHSNDSWI